MSKITFLCLLVVIVQYDNTVLMSEWENMYFNILN